MKLIHRDPLHPYILTMENHKEKLRTTIMFTICNKKIKYLGLNLPNETKDLYAKNYKALIKEIKDNTNRWRDIP